MDHRTLVHKHRKKIIAGTPIIFLLLLGGSGILGGGNTLTFSLEQGAFIEIGDELPVTLLLSTRSPINAVGGSVVFPPEQVRVDSLARTSSIIDLWSEEPMIDANAGTVRFSGGLIGPHVGVSGNKGPVFTLMIRGVREGKAVLRIKDAELLANDGSGENQVSGVGSIALYVRPLGRATPDINRDGALTISDVNSLYLKTFRAYDADYDMNGDGKLDWSDVRYLITLL